MGTGAGLSRNEREILRLLRQRGPTPRATLAQATGLSAQAVTNITRKLIEAGLVMQGEAMRGKVGQPRMPLSLNPDAALFLGLKLGRRLIELALVDFTGGIREHVWQLHSAPQPDRVLTFARDGILRLVAGLSPDARARLAGCGIATPFRLWDWGAEFAAWRGRDIRAELAAELAAARLNLPVLLENDASAACLGELVFGTEALPADFLYLYIGHYIGGGLVLDGRLRSGPTGNAAAVASLPLADGAQLLEVASVSTLERSLGRALPPEDEAWSVPEAVQRRWLRQTAEALGQTGLTAAALCDLPLVIIDGALPPQIRAALVRETRAAVSRLPGAGIDPPELREGSLGRRARLLGAAALPLAQDFLPES